MKIKTILILNFILVLFGCSNNQTSKISQDKEFQTVIERAVKWMPSSYKEIYKVDNFELPEYNLSPYFGINESNKDEFYSEIDRIIAKDMSLCIDTLLQIDSLNTSFIPSDSKFYKNEKWLIFSKAYNSRKTDAKVNIYLVYKSKEEYYTFHFWDTHSIESNLVAFKAYNLPEIYGQVKKSNDCTRNFKVQLTDSIRFFYLSKCTDNIINSDKITIKEILKTASH